VRQNLRHEPLIHFALAGLAIFLMHAGWQHFSAVRASEIHVSKADIARMSALYAAESGKLPTPEDIAAMVADHVRDAALSREARRLGLDVDDTIVTRRLAQKMTFMVADLAEIPVPDDAALTDWMAAHPSRFENPQRLTFTHIFISPDVRGKKAAADAGRILAALKSGAANDWQTQGDPFMLQREFGETPVREIARIFGPDFASQIAALPGGPAWQGPVKSGFGLHLVRVSRNAPRQLLPLETVRADVLADWQENARRRASEAAVAKIIAQYKVSIDDPK
jgi:peptidyl-prolyl cis-trans isomerase C